MTLAEHKQRHVELHRAFDELLADFITHTKSSPSKVSVMELVEWSNSQTLNPTENEYDRI